MRGLPKMVKELLTKSRESALLAVEVYNKPATTFKSGSYISLMVIAWTALFHAYFHNKRVKPFYKKKNSTRFEQIEERIGKNIFKSKKWWDLSKCIKEYYASNLTAERKNLELFIQLRNMIEHRTMPDLDINIFGECQSLILNYDNFLEQHFGKKYMLREQLSHALQFSFNENNLMSAKVSELKRKGMDGVVKFIKAYRKLLSTSIFQDDKYSFKFVLLKVGNHESRNALPIKFVDFERLSEEEKKKIHDSGIVLSKEKIVAVGEDKMLNDYTLDYKSLCDKLKTTYSSFKQNAEFHNFRKSLIVKEPSLVYRRLLDPSKPSGAKKDWYHPRIISKFRGLYPSN